MRGFEEQVRLTTPSDVNDELMLGGLKDSGVSRRLADLICLVASMGDG